MECIVVYNDALTNRHINLGGRGMKHDNRTKPLQKLRHVAGGALLFAACAISAQSAYAGSATFSSTNIQYLYGNKYELGDKARSIVTLEHVNAWKYGDNFFFVDITNPNRKGDATGTEFYGEISPRLSLGALIGKPLSFGPVKDVLITTTMEVGDAGSGFHNYLYGIAVDLNILPVAQINYYVRHEIDAGTALGSQLTLVWLAPFKAGPLAMTFEGFFDYAWGNEPKEDNIVAGPRLLVDVGNFFGAPGALQAGVEYQYWKNKFGVKDVNESCPQAMVKWIW